MATATLTPSIDAEVISTSATSNFGTNDELGSGEENTSSTVIRTFVKFDLSSIPTTAIVDSASLEFTVLFDSSDNSRTHRILRTDASWTEGGITWNNQPGVTGTELGNATLANNIGVGGKATFTLTAAEVQGLIDGTYINNGFRLKADTETNDLYKFRSRENGTASNRPTLTINYHLPDVGGSPMLFGGGITIG